MGMHPLATTDWLNEHLHDPDIRILDATWYLPSDARDPQAEYALEHIPGAMSLSLLKFVRQASLVDDVMLPS